MRRGIGPHDTLPGGTTVFSRRLRGEVAGAKVEKDQHGGPIVVHEVRWTHQRDARGRYRPLEKEHSTRINYSFLTYEDSETKGTR